MLPEQRKFALESRGAHFCFKFLFKKGHHLFIIGTSGSGKTQKMYWVLRWIKTTKESIVWLDSAKNREMVPLLKMGFPVRVICPKGCDVVFTEWNDAEHKYTRIKDHPEVVTVPDAGSAWWAVKKGAINIFCFRNFFDEKKDMINWMGELFETLSLWIKRNRFPRIRPMAIFGDESHWFLAGEKITKDSERTALSDLITELSLEDRANGVRLILAAQSHKSLPPASRENMIHNLICRGCKVSSDENNSLSPYNSYSSKYHPNEGVFVYEGGYAYPHNSEGTGYPWPFPFFPMPNIKVTYSGEFNPKTPEAIEEKEKETELLPDINRYQALLYDLKDFEIPKVTGRYEAIPDDTT